MPRRSNNLHDGNGGSPKLVQLGFKVPPELKERIEKVAPLLGNDVANFLRRLLLKHLPDYEKEAGLLPEDGLP